VKLSNREEEEEWRVNGVKKTASRFNEGEEKNGTKKR
jgi:hypothetical protein